MVRRPFIRLQVRKSSCDRVLCCLLVHIFKIEKSISSNGSQDIAKSLTISFGSSFVSLRAFGSKFWQFHLYTPFKHKKPHSTIFTRSWVLVYITFAHGRTTDIFRKSFLFSSWARIYTHVYTYLDYFSNFTPFLTKVRIPFFPYWIRSYFTWKVELL